VPLARRGFELEVGVNLAIFLLPIMSFITMAVCKLVVRLTLLLLLLIRLMLMFRVLMRMAITLL
jgi:hypothetical protein